MGITAENIAKAYNLTREEQDALALSSQQKAVSAIERSAFKARNRAGDGESRKRGYRGGYR